jgi:hypothetical protein
MDGKPAGEAEGEPDRSVAELREDRKRTENEAPGLPIHSRYAKIGTGLSETLLSFVTTRNRTARH